MKRHDRKWLQMGLVKIENKAVVQNSSLFEFSICQLRVKKKKNVENCSKQVLFQIIQTR